MSKKEEVIPSSGNVFADLEIDNPEEARAKSEIARQITAIIKGRDLSLSSAGIVLGVDKAKVSALTNGRLSGFSTDRLLRFLVALDCDVEITIRSKVEKRARIHVHSE